MKSNFENFIRSMNEKFSQLNNRFDQIEKRIDKIIESHRGTHKVHTQFYLPRPLSLSTQPYAPSVNGSQDPEIYVDWEKRMDQYFD